MRFKWYNPCDIRQKQLIHRTWFHTMLKADEASLPGSSELFLFTMGRGI